MSIVIVDDHPATGVGLSTIVASQPKLRVVGGPATVESALSLDVPKVDICILGLSGPAVIGKGALSTVHRKWPDARVLVIAEHDDDSALESYIRHDGVGGFVSKRAAPAVIVEAVEHLARGERYFKLDRPNGPNTPHAETPSLTPKQMEVLRMLDRGLTVTAIASIMGRSVKTTSSHKVNLQKKLGAKSTAQIVPLARTLGLI